MTVKRVSALKNCKRRYTSSVNWSTAIVAKEFNWFLRAGGNSTARESTHYHEYHCSMGRRKVLHILEQQSEILIQNAYPYHTSASAWTCILAFSPARSCLVLHIQLIYKQSISNYKCWVSKIWHYKRGLKNISGNHLSILRVSYQLAYTIKTHNSTIN